MGRTRPQFPNAKTVPDGHLTGPDLCHLAGITYRQLDYWTRTDILRTTSPAPGSGYVRAFPASELPFTLLLKQLLDDGMNLRAAVALARQLLETGHALVAGIRIDLPQDL